MREHLEVDSLDWHVGQTCDERVSVGEPVPDSYSNIIARFDAGLGGAEKALKKVSDLTDTYLFVRTLSSRALTVLNHSAGLAGTGTKP
jgi:hypothetical protein